MDTLKSKHEKQEETHTQVYQRRIHKTYSACSRCVYMKCWFADGYKNDPLGDTEDTVWSFE